MASARLCTTSIAINEPCMTAKAAPQTPRIDPESIGPRLQSYWDTTVAWVQGNVVELGIAVAAAVMVFLLLSWLKRVAAKIARESEHRAELKSIIARTLARTSKFFRIMVAVELVNRYANAPRNAGTHHRRAVHHCRRHCRLRSGCAKSSSASSSGAPVTASTSVTRWRARWCLSGCWSASLVFAIAAIVILDNLGVNVTGLVAGLGVGGIAIGLAAQGIFSDLFAAMSIIFDKPFRRGDTVTYDTTTARVEQIGMKSTRLRALTGEEKIISNSKLLEKEITNNTLTVYRRVNFPLALVYHTPPATAAKVPDIIAGNR